MFFYFIIVFLVFITQLTKRSVFQTKYFAKFLILIMLTLVSVVILLNPYTGDMERYLFIFNQIRNMSWIKALMVTRWEPGFITYQWILSKIFIHDISFILISIILMWAMINYALKKIVDRKDIPLIMIGYMSSFYFYNLSRNIVRQGFAAVFLLLAIIYLRDEKNKKLFLWLAVSVSFHISAIIGLILVFVKKKNVSMKTIFSIYIMSVLLMITNINQIMMSKLSSMVGGRLESSVSLYSSDSVLLRYGSVNRIDFLIFTTFWLVIAFSFRNKYLKEDLIYDWLIKSYMVLSIVYILFGFIGFSDRLAAYAWFLIPLLTFYPVVTMKSKYKDIWVTICIFINIGMFVFLDVITLYEPIRGLFLF